MKARNKLTSNADPVTTVVRTTDPDGNLVSSYETTNNASISYKRTDGYDLDRFHQRKRAGELLPFTPFTQYEYGASGYTSYENDQTSGYRVWHDNTGAADYFVIPEARMHELAEEYGNTRPHVQAAAASIYAQGHDTLTFLVEFKDLVRMWTNISGRIVKLIRTKGVDSAWLEYRYGWRVLYYDIVSLFDALTLMLDPDRTRFQQRAGISHRFSESSVVRDINDGASEHTIWTAHDDYQISVRGNVVADIKPPPFMGNLAVTAWESVKFSFILDWVFGIGQWIAAMSFKAFSTQYCAAGGILIKGTRRITSTTQQLNTSLYNVTRTISGQGSATYTLRSPTTVSNLPQLHVNIDIAKVFDLIALLGGGRKAINKATDVAKKRRGNKRRPRGERK